MNIRSLFSRVILIAVLGLLFAIFSCQKTQSPAPPSSQSSPPASRVSQPATMAFPPPGQGAVLPRPPPAREKPRIPPVRKPPSDPGGGGNYTPPSGSTDTVKNTNGTKNGNKNR
jgi:hypothetical protein